MKIKKPLFARLEAGLLLLVVMGLPMTPLQAATPACGTVLSSDTKLDSNMNCPSRALFFSGPQSDNVVLNCDGYTISTTSDRIISANFVNKITIKNCNFSTTHDDGRGLVFTGVTRSKVFDNTITTAGDGSGGLDIRGDSNFNLIKDNVVHTGGEASTAIRIRAGSKKNLVKDNIFEADNSYAVAIQSADQNELSSNTLTSPQGFLWQAPFSLQNGGIAVDAAGNIFAVENNWGSSAPNGAGIGEATAFFQVDPVTGTPLTTIPLLQGGKLVDFGFDALEILPNGRVLALRGCCPSKFLYEIDPASGEVSELDIFMPAGSQGGPNGLDAIDNNTLLATTNQGNLISINLVTESMSLLGDVGTGWTGIATHPTSGKTYTVSRRRNEASNTAHLYEINPANGQVIGEIGDTGILAISGIDFAPDGTLYGSYNLETIDINTGVATTVGDFGPDPLEPLSKKTLLKDNLLKNADGSIRFDDKIKLPTIDVIDISADNVAISANEVFVDSALLPFLDEPARITLNNLPGTWRNLLVDPEDDGSFVPCDPKQCDFVTFMDGNLVFDVEGFTTYSSEDNTDPDGQFVVAVVHAEVKALLDEGGFSKSVKKKLKSAAGATGKAGKFFGKDKVKKGFEEIAKAVKNLDKAEPHVPTAGILEGRLVDAAQGAAQNAIDEAIVAVGDPDLIAAAEAAMDAAQDFLDAGKPDKAIKSFYQALKTADKAS